MPNSLRLIGIIFLFSLILGACEALPSSSGEGGAAPLLPFMSAGRTPEETVRTFLEAWNSENFEAMYQLLSPRSAAIYPYEAFVEQYHNTDTQMSFAGVTYTIKDTHLQGTSAAITYDVNLQSTSFGEIEDPDRTIRLVDEGDGWHIAWSPMDIINGMTSSVRLQYVPRFAERANIYDRFGKPLVEQNGTLWRVYLLEDQMRSTEECFNLLARLMFRPYGYFVRRSVDYLSDAAYYVGELDDEIVRENRSDLDTICGMDQEVEFFGDKLRSSAGRNYFGHGAMSHITGYIGRVPSDSLSFWESRGYRASDIVGLTGVEFTMEEHLAGKPERYLRLIDPGGVVLRELGGATGTAPSPVQLTIDRNMQMEFAQAFNDSWNYSTADWASVAPGGAGVVMDVNTGAILAMFSYPTFDPRIFDPSSTYENAQEEISRAAQGDPFLPTQSALVNRAFSEQYAPGSTFKIITELAAADSGTWAYTDIFDCQLIWEGQTRFRDALAFREDWRVVMEYPAAGLITMSEALTTSCNPFFWEVGALMFQQNPAMLHDYALELGLGQRTGLVGLTNEAAGRIPLPGDVTSALNNAIGQGDTQVTAIQMARVVSAVANGGILYQPYIIQQIGGLDGTPIVESFNPEMLAEVNISDEAIQSARAGMCQVPINERLGTSYGIFRTARYSSCGKTGTAQTSLYPNSWYVAYAPADNPTIAIAVVVPSSREGSEVAAPIIRRFLDLYFDAPLETFPEWWQTPYVPLEPPRGVIPDEA